MIQHTLYLVVDFYYFAFLSFMSEPPPRAAQGTPSHQQQNTAAVRSTGVKEHNLNFTEQANRHEIGSWDQFEANKKLIQDASTYDDLMYTTPIPQHIPLNFFFFFLPTNFFFFFFKQKGGKSAIRSNFFFFYSVIRSITFLSPYPPNGDSDFLHSLFKSRGIGWPECRCWLSSVEVVAQKTSRANSQMVRAERNFRGSRTICKSTAERCGPVHREYTDFRFLSRKGFLALERNANMMLTQRPIRKLCAAALRIVPVVTHVDLSLGTSTSVEIIAQRTPQRMIWHMVRAERDFAKAQELFATQPLPRYANLPTENTPTHSVS